MTTYELGTVAVATVRGQSSFRVLLVDGGPIDGPMWVHSADTDGWNVSPLSAVTDVRPLVVLDPSEIGGMGEFRARNFEGARSYAAHVRLANPCAGDLIDWLADQIEAQTRPAIEEPTGLGAVVEDEDGMRWVRVNHPEPNKPWRRSDPAALHAHWQAVHAVRVLSEGVAE